MFVFVSVIFVTSVYSNLSPEILHNNCYSTHKRIILTPMRHKQYILPAQTDRAEKTRDVSLNMHGRNIVCTFVYYIHLSLEIIFKIQTDTILMLMMMSVGNTRVV